MKTLKSVVVHHPFWTGLNPKLLHPFLDTARLIRCGADEIIFREGDEATRFYLVDEGRVVLETFVPGSGMTPIQTLGTGDALGWSWLFAPYRWHLTARTAEPTEIVSLDAAVIRVTAETNHDFGYAVVLRVAQILSQRLQATRLQLLDLHGVAC